MVSFFGEGLAICTTARAYLGLDPDRTRAFDRLSELLAAVRYSTTRM
jgi:hypothetical protein